MSNKTYTIVVQPIKNGYVAHPRVSERYMSAEGDAMFYRTTGDLHGALPHLLDEAMSLELSEDDDSDDVTPF